jgi:phytoene synthase
MDTQAISISRDVLAEKSKSFAMAAKLLPASCRDAIAVVYAWCRRVDDAIDLAPVAERPSALERLRGELDRVYGGEPTHDPVVDAFAEVVRAYGIPRHYPAELVEGMAMDVARVRYRTRQELLLYCYRVAGVVGLMLCHVMGVSDPRALRNAAHLGIAMQLTNICRDVDEDLRDGRLYLPGQEVQDERDRPAIVRTVSSLLDDADRYYDSADRGLLALSFRCALAVRAARLVYSAIGARLRRRGCDPFLGRVYVSTFGKLLLVLFALVLSVLELPRRIARRQRTTAPDRVLGFPHDVVPV